MHSKIRWQYGNAANEKDRERITIVIVVVLNDYAAGFLHARMKVCVCVYGRMCVGVIMHKHKANNASGSSQRDKTALSSHTQR